MPRGAAAQACVDLNQSDLGAWADTFGTFRLPRQRQSPPCATRGASHRWADDSDCHPEIRKALGAGRMIARADRQPTRRADAAPGPSLRSGTLRPLNLKRSPAKNNRRPGAWTKGWQ